MCIRDRDHRRGAGAPQGADRAAGSLPNEHQGHRRGRRRTAEGVAEMRALAPLIAVISPLPRPTPGGLVYFGADVTRNRFVAEH